MFTWGRCGSEGRGTVADERGTARTYCASLSLSPGGARSETRKAGLGLLLSVVRWHSMPDSGLPAVRSRGVIDLTPVHLRIPTA